MARRDRRASCKAIGYRYVTIDLQGYRTGSLNEGLLLRPAVTQALTAHASARPRVARGRCSSRSTCRFFPHRSKISTRSTSRSACAHFDVAQHQPHPPGYPLFIARGKARARRRSVRSAARSALLGIVAGALGVLALVGAVPRAGSPIDRARPWRARWRGARRGDGAAVLVHRRAAAERHAGPGRGARRPGARRCRRTSRAGVIAAAAFWRPRRRHPVAGRLADGAAARAGDRAPAATPSALADAAACAARVRRRRARVGSCRSSC